MGFTFFRPILQQYIKILHDHFLTPTYTIKSHADMRLSRCVWNKYTYVHTHTYVE